MTVKSEVEELNPYGSGDKREQVEEMFDSIAPAYDFMNGMMSFGQFRHWRNKALRLAQDEVPEARSILDVATGTGDMAFEMLRRFPLANIVGIDLSAGMLKEARRKISDLPPALAKRISFDKGDSLALPYDDGRFDLVTVAYGVRNFADLEKGLAEMNRVLKPGGLLTVIELSEPKNPLTHTAYRFYAHRLIPALGRRVSGDKSAYSYLPSSIAACPQRRDFALIMRKAGFKRCRWMSLTFGVVTIYLGTKRF